MYRVALVCKPVVPVLTGIPIPSSHTRQALKEIKGEEDWLHRCVFWPDPRRLLVGDGGFRLNGGCPTSWMVYQGKSTYKMDDFRVPPFMEPPHVDLHWQSLSQW